MDGNHTPTAGQPVQPGQTISPGSAAPLPETPPAPIPEAPAPSPSEPETPLDPETTDVPAAAFIDTPADTAVTPPATGVVSWTASEFIAHEKSASWYIVLLGGAVILAGLNWLIFKDITSSVVIVLAVAILAAYSKRQPRELPYTLDDQGLTIGEKHYPYSHFRSFSVIEEGPFSSIELMPLKRFSPPISIYYDPENEDAIAEALTPHLPFQPREQDPVDKLIRRIRF